MKTPDSDSSGPDWVPTILWGIFDARGGATADHAAFQALIQMGD